MKCGVKSIVTQAGRASALLLDDGTEITADHIISSIGAPETESLLTAGSEDTLSSERPSSSRPAPTTIPAGRLSFIETITVLNRQPADLGWGSDTIVFFNDSAHLEYARPAAQVDPRSGVICIPNNFDYGPDRALPDGLLRVTCLANFDHWNALPPDEYAAAKERWFGAVQRSALRFLPALPHAGALEQATVTTDMFTPRTITKFTGHFAGAIYGAAIKNRQGRTSVENVYLCGTDQGFLGIVGAMLSGISMANYHILQKSLSSPRAD